MSRLPLKVALRAAPAELRTRAAARVERMRRRGPFSFDGEQYEYLLHHYNTTWRNERAVEVPLAARLIERRRGERMLEVGNVLHNYLDAAALPGGRDVVDRYEVAPGVHNVDVLDYEPVDPYDLIVSISTIEHVGRDEEPKDPAKAAAAIERLHTWLAPGGELLVTIPLGYHPDLDRSLVDGQTLFQNLGFLKRVSADNRWVEASADEVRGTPFARPFPAANALAVGRSRA